MHPSALYAALRGRLRAVFRRGQVERELDEEVRFHLEMETEKNLRAGMSAADARGAALLAFGEVDRMREAHRDAHRDARGTAARDSSRTRSPTSATRRARSPGRRASSPCRCSRWRSRSPSARRCSRR
jgi:hypothetical protein